MNYRDVFDRGLRLTLLRSLATAAGEELNSSILTRMVDEFGFNVKRAVVHEQLRHLESLRAVELEQLSQDLIVARLCQAGRDHLERRGPALEGVDWPTRR